MTEAPLANFFDGRTADRRPAKLRLGADRLFIASAADEAPLAEWPYSQLRVIERPYGKNPGLLGSNANEEARLAIADAALFASLAERAPRPTRHFAPRHAAAIVVAAAAAAAGMWFAWTPALDMVARAVPLSWEAAIGRSLLTDVAPKNSVCANAAGQAALDRLVARLSGPIARSQEIAFHIQVVRNKLVNAFALPGGQIVFMSGLIDRADSPDEAAGVLAHEMAHVAERHSMRLMLRQYGLTLLVAAFFGNTHWADGLSFFGVLAYSREFEAQADARALEALTAAGMRSSGLASFFARMEKDRGNNPGLARYFATHPPMAERREQAQRRADMGGPPMSDADWKAVRAICNGS